MRLGKREMGDKIEKIGKEARAPRAGCCWRCCMQWRKHGFCASAVWTGIGTDEGSLMQCSPRTSANDAVLKA